jgi:hypothetical protein
VSDYKDRLNVAKKEYISTDGDGEAGVRLIWTLKQVGHSYTNMDVENLRFLFPKLQAESPFGKDWAYIIGHVTQLFVIPTIVFDILARRKAKD